MPYRQNLAESTENFDNALETATGAVDNFNQTVEDNRTQTIWRDGRAVTQQWNPEANDWRDINTYDREYDLLDEALGMEWDTMEDWAKDNAHLLPDGTNAWDYYQEGQARTAQNMETVTQDYTPWAKEQSAQSLGFMDRGQMDDLLQRLVTNFTGPIDDLQGLTDRENEVYRELGHNNLRQMESSLARQLDSVAAGGSTMQYLAAADQVRMQMSDARLQHEYQILQTDFERKVMESERNMQSYAMLVQLGAATEQEYIAGVRADHINAFQAYAAGAQQIMAQRAVDLEAQQAHVQTIYQGIQVSIGISQHAIDTSAAIYEESVKPARELLNSAFAEANLHLNAMGTYGALQHQHDMAKEAKKARKRASRGGFWRGIGMAALGAAAMIFVPGAQGFGAALLFAGATETAGNADDTGYF